MTERRTGRPSRLGDRHLTPGRRFSTGRIAGLLGIGLAAGLMASRAAAAVIDIAPDGRVTVTDGPTQQLSPDPGSARPIAPLRNARAAAQRPEVPPGARAQVADAISSAARTEGLSTDLIAAVAWQESRFRADAVSPKGAVGVMQLMPGTARSLGVPAGDVYANVHGGAAYLRQLSARYDGDLVKILAAYNAGPAAVDRYGGPPPYRETRAYVDAVLEHLAERVAPIPPTLRTRSRP